MRSAKPTSNSAAALFSDDSFRTLERERLRSLVERDMALALELHSPDFELVTPRGAVYSRDAYLGAVDAGAIAYLRWEAEAIQVRRFEGVALLRYRAELEMASRDGSINSFRCWHIDSYELREGAWRVVWSQATLAGEAS